MGQHTWCYKNRELYDEEQSLYKALDAHESGERYLDELEIISINSNIDDINELNETDYHDIFRTHKRNIDGTYTDDVIYSKEECDKWLEENKELTSSLDKELVDLFWKEYPKGVIDFG